MRITLIYIYIKLYLLKYVLEKYSIYLHKYICTKYISLSACKYLNTNKGLTATDVEYEGVK